MARQIKFDGRIISVPDDATDEDIRGILSGPSSAPPPARGIVDRFFSNPIGTVTGALRESAESILEPAATLATGMVAAPVANLAGVAGDIYAGLTGTQRIGNEVRGDVQRALTFTPRSAGGQRNLEAIGREIEASKLEGLPAADLTLLAQTARAAAPAADATRIAASKAAGAVADEARILSPFKPAPTPQQLAATSSDMGAMLDNLAAMRAQGLTVNPIRTNPTTKNRVGGALVGDEILDMEARRRNQPRIRAMIRNDLDLPEGTALNKDAFGTVKQRFIDVSKEVEGVKSLPVDDTFRAGLTDKTLLAEISPEEAALLKETPRVTALLAKVNDVDSFSGRGAIAIMRQLRSESSSVLNNPQATSQARALAQVQRNVSKQIEALIERKVDPDLAERFRQARTGYAKASAYETVVDANGVVDVTKLKSKKGNTSYTDELALLRDLGAAFPAEMKPPVNRTSGLDASYGGRWNKALELLSTPVQKRMLSEGYQTKNAFPPDYRRLATSASGGEPMLSLAPEGALPAAPAFAPPPTRGLLSLADQTAGTPTPAAPTALEFPVQPRFGALFNPTAELGPPTPSITPTPYAGTLPPELPPLLSLPPPTAAISSLPLLPMEADALMALLKPKTKAKKKAKIEHTFNPRGMMAR